MTGRIDLKSATVLEALQLLAEGNPGAGTVLAAMRRQMDEPAWIMRLLELDDMAMYGAAIWIGYKDWAKEDLDVFASAIKTKNPAMIDFINTHPGRAQGQQRVVASGNAL